MASRESSELPSGDFVPVRSRSAPGTRLGKKSSEAEVAAMNDARSDTLNAEKEAFLKEGSRYFSQAAERVGLDG